jgi:capsular polysaccharide biosynthesis protein
VEVASILRDLWRRRVLIVVLVVLGILAALLTSYKLPSFQKRSLQLGAASSQILVDSPDSTLVSGGDQLGILATRSRIFAQYLSSPEARQAISQASGIPARQIIAKGPFSTDTGAVQYEPAPAEVRSKQIVDEKSGYRLIFTSQQDVPIISVASQAPSADAARKLASASFVALKRYVTQLQSEGGSGSTNVLVRQLGEPEAGTVGGGNNIILMIFAFIAVVGTGCVLIPIAAGVARNWRMLDDADEWNLGDESAEALRLDDDELELNADDWLDDRDADVEPQLGLR